MLYALRTIAEEIPDLSDFRVFQPTSWTSWTLIQQNCLAIVETKIY